MPGIAIAGTRLDLTPLTPDLGAVIHGLDLARPLAPEQIDAVRAAFLAHRILVFRDQDLTKRQQVAFSLQFGELERHTVRNRGQDDEPFVHVVSNLGADGLPTGKVGSTMWHTDKSFRPLPSMATILHARVLPPGGGDTLFADMHAAYAALPADERSALDGGKVVHSWEHSRENAGRQMSAAEKQDAPANAWPLARTHPETGRIALFMGMHACWLEGMPHDVGRAKIEALETHATADRFVYRHSWRAGDMLMWDNRCLLHRADPNFDAATHPRVMHRTCLRGTAPA